MEQVLPHLERVLRFGCVLRVRESPSCIYVTVSDIDADDQIIAYGQHVENVDEALRRAEKDCAAGHSQGFENRFKGSGQPVSLEDWQAKSASPLNEWFRSQMHHGRLACFMRGEQVTATLSGIPLAAPSIPVSVILRARKHPGEWISWSHDCSRLRFGLDEKQLPELLNEGLLGRETNQTQFRPDQPIFRQVATRRLGWADRVVYGGVPSIGSGSHISEAIANALVQDKLRLESMIAAKNS